MNFRSIRFPMAALLCLCHPLQGRSAEREFPPPAGWTAVDIGTVPGAGKTALNSRQDSPRTVWSITGAGDGVAGKADAFHFCCTQITGDFEMMVRIIRNRDWTAQTGIMLRESLDADARFKAATAESSPGGVAFYRLLKDDEVRSNRMNRLEWIPCTLKLIRIGDQVGMWYTYDNDTWHYSRFGGTLRDLPPTMYVGMFRSAGKDGRRTAAQFDQLRIQPPSKELRTSWIGNTLPGGECWVQAGVNTLAVEPVTGRIFLAGADEKFATACYEADGRHVGYGVVSHFRNGTSIAADPEFYYHAEGKKSIGVRKYLHDGRVAPAPNVALKDQVIEGLAVTADQLLAASSTDDKIHLLDKTTLEEESSFVVKGAGNIAVDPDGTLWVIIRAGGGRTAQIVHLNRSGKRLGKPILDVDDPRGIALHPKTGHLHVADRYPRQQILEFDRQGRLFKTFGAEHGIYSRYDGTGPGEVHPLKLNHPVGVGFDAAGNMTVACNGPAAPWAGGTGTELRHFSPEGKLLWARYGLEYVDNACADPADDGVEVFDKEHHYTIDYSKPSGQEWQYQGMTFDPYRFPDDPRRTQPKPGPVLVRRVHGRRILSILEMKGKYLALYRFEEGSEIAVPTAFFSDSKVWIDRNDDGQMQDGEWCPAMSKLESVQFWYPDDEGNIWIATKHDGIYCLPCTGISAAGTPQYATAFKHDEAPVDFTGPGTEINRVVYLPKTDTLLVGGYSSKNPLNDRSWTAMGPDLVRYDGWCRGERTKTYHMELPYMPKVPDGHESYAVNGISVAGDYIFTSESATSHIRVYRLKDGVFVKTLVPGGEVAGIVALIDVCQGVNAYRRSDGEYIIFVEEDSRAKVLMLRWRP